MKTTGRGRGIAIPFLQPWCWWCWVVSTTTWTLFPRKEPEYQFHRRLRRPEGRPGKVLKISPSQGVQTPNKPFHSHI